MTTEHEQPTELTYPDGTQLANNDNCTIRFILADQSDSDQEDDGSNIRRFHPTRLLEHRDEEINKIIDGEYDSATGQVNDETRGNQMIPTDITSPYGSTIRTHTEPDASSGHVRKSNDNGEQLQEISAEGVLRCY